MYFRIAKGLVYKTILSTGKYLGSGKGRCPLTVRNEKKLNENENKRVYFRLFRI
jgi:hypothetical protein